MTANPADGANPILLKGTMMATSLAEEFRRAGLTRATHATHGSTEHGRSEGDGVARSAGPSMTTSDAHPPADGGPHRENDRWRVEVTRRNLAWRCGGAVAIVAAGGASLLHRDVLAAHVSGPASPLEFVLGLVSFALASFGLLLLWHGAGLRDSWTRDCERRGEASSRNRGWQDDQEEEQARLSVIACDPFALPGGRTAIAIFLADRAISAAAASKERASRPPDSMKAGPST